MKQKIMIAVFLTAYFQSIDPNALDTMKGIWSSVESFPKKFAGFFKSLGQSFGAPPSGYVYSFDVYNDIADKSVYVAVNEIMSLMGGDLPKPHGWIQSSAIAPFNHYLINNQDYYFELFIKLTDKNFSSHMPYLAHDDVLFRQEVTALQGQKNSQKLHYFRTFMGKNLQNGVYVHQPHAESLGYFNQNADDAKSDPGNVTIGSVLSSLTIFNSSQNDFYVGFVPTAKASSMTPKMCTAYGLVAKNSFALLNTTSSMTSLSPGTIGLFDAASEKLIKTYSLPSYVFCTLPSRASMPYTLEIYQDAQEKSVSMNLQGLMSGNYDQAIGNVRDITPVTSVFWYESVAQAGAGVSGFIDLTMGKVWIVSVEDTFKIIASATPGQALQWSMTRPLPNKKLWLYFVYVATSNDVLAKQYLQNFFSQPLGQSMLQTYHQQSLQQIKNAAQPGVTKKSVPQDLLVQAAQGVLSLNGGSVEINGVTGYLLGGDIFMSVGVGSGPMYYILQPSESNSQNLMIPTATVQNLFISSAGSTTAPKSMPTPIVVQ